MNRGHKREVVFQTDDDHAFFLNLLGRYRQRFPVRLHRDCRMSNDFHLLRWCAEQKALSSFMAGRLRAYGHHHHRQ
jgi:REP element-mobilizing transposase RayT